jgi:RNA 3'-terminal phosphate cyclase (ATP)
MIQIDGSHGEGGGQVLRTSLTLAILTGQALLIENIRAGRPNPGLAAQHLASVRAAAAVCDAAVEGDELGSKQLKFEPGCPVQGGDYTFDVAEMRAGGSAGAVSLVFQTVFLPLALATEPSRLVLRGGTHVAWSPPFPYLDQVYLWMLEPLGLKARLTLHQWGFYPAGGGHMVAEIPGGVRSLDPLSLTERQPLQRVWGTAAVANLPSHIPQRMANRARNVLAESDIKADVQALRVRANGPGAGIFILAEYDNHVRVGFTAYGRKGLPAERVAEAACDAFITYHQSDAPVDMHLADQLILPLTMANGQSTFTAEHITEHLRTNLWVVEQFKVARFRVSDHTVSLIPMAE